MNSLKMIALISMVGMFATGQAYAQEATPGEIKASHKIRADIDRDGKISHEEFRVASKKRSEKHFKRMDANADGFIDKSERQAAFAKSCEHHRHTHKRSAISQPG